MIFPLFVCFDLGFHTSNPVIKYRPDASCMSHMEARQKCPERTTLSLHSPGLKGCWSRASATSLPPRMGLEPARRRLEVSKPNRLSHPGRLSFLGYFMSKMYSAPLATPSFAELSANHTGQYTKQMDEQISPDLHILTFPCRISKVFSFLSLVWVLSMPRKKN